MFTVIVIVTDVFQHVLDKNRLFCDISVNVELGALGASYFNHLQSQSSKSNANRKNYLPQCPYPQGSFVVSRGKLSI
jgi:ABC-type polysaccharide/polyol phosphate export permease